MEKTVRPPKTAIRKWVNALRSGVYSQTYGELQKKNGFCCLGVACMEFIPMYKLVFEPLNDGKSGSVKLFGTTPFQQDNAPDWLININAHFYKLTGQNLAALNDIHGFNFDEIADLLQLVYLEAALDDQV